MLPIKRLEEIKRILTENKQADVPSLAQELNVTEATIRRDLEKLENEQFLTRTHGGAVLNEQEPAEISLFQLPDNDKDVYSNIGKIAAQFIQHNQVIFLGPGLCSRFIVRNLQSKMNVTILTTDLMVAHDCAVHSPNVSVILPGGNVNPSTLNLSGTMTSNTLDSFYFDASFFDIDGITMKRGYSVSSVNTAYLIQHVFEISKKNFALCPYDRFNSEAPAIVGDINMFPSVITNERADASYKEYYFKHKIQVFATFNI